MDNGQFENLLDSLHLGDVLHGAARVDDIHGMKTCIEEGENVNGRDQNGLIHLCIGLHLGED